MATQREQVAAAVDEVWARWKEGLAKYDALWFPSEQEKNARGGLSSIKGAIQKWADNGFEYASRGADSATWTRWNNAKRGLVEDMSYFDGLGAAIRSEDVRSTIAEAPTVAAQTLRKATKVIGESAGNLVAPAASALKLPILLALAGLGTFVALRLGLLSRAAK